MNKQSQQQLQSFLDEIRQAKDPQDLALIILEDKKQRPVATFWQKSDQCIFFDLSDSSASETFIEQLVSAQKDSKDFIVNIKADPHPAVINIFKEILHFGRINLRDRHGNINNVLDISSKNKIIAVAERDFINKQISYRNFYNLFGSALVLK